MNRNLSSITIMFATLALTTGCTPAMRATSREIDLSSYFPDADACFVMLDLQRGEMVRYNPQRCAKRFSPCSTFKIPNSLIGLESGVIPDADHVIKWDGQQRDRPELNRDHTLRSAMQYSVVWYYQELATRVGMERMQRFVDAIPYGNRDLSDGLTQFWLDHSLKISADEQVEFLRRLYRNDLPFSQRSIDIVKDITILQREGDAVFRGKTGSARAARGEPDLGWFVGYVESAGQVHIFASNISSKGQFGPQTRDVVKRILVDQHIWPR